MKHLILLTLLFSNVCFAQQKQKPTYPVYINYPDYTVKAEVFSEQKKMSVNENLTYFWYSSNKIIETKGGYDGKVLNGLYTSFYLSKNLKEKGTFKNGLKTSIWTCWNEDGKMNEITTWKKGVKCGRYKKYNNAGDLVSESSYKNGTLNGYKIDYEKGKVISKKKYKNDLEVIPKEKKQKVDSTTQATSAKKEKKSIFKKKDKETTPKVAPTDKPKKTLKERWNSLFKKKEKTKDSKTADK